MPHVEGEEGTQGHGPFCGQATRTRMEGTTGHLLEAGEDVGCSVRAQGLLGDRWPSGRRGCPGWQAARWPQASLHQALRTAVPRDQTLGV